MKTSSPSNIGGEPNHLGQKILVVDDEEDLRRFVKLRLSRAGYKVFEASNGTEGMKQFHKVKPHLVILDIMMPKMDGWETCRRIREISDVPILILSAKGDRGSRVKGLDLGANDYLAKPFAGFELLKKIKVLLAMSSLEREIHRREILEVARVKRMLERNIESALSEELVRLTESLIHDLSNGLGTMRNSIDLLLDSIDEYDPIRRSILSLEKSFQNCMALVNGLQELGFDKELQLQEVDADSVRPEDVGRLTAGLIYDFETALEHMEETAKSLLPKFAEDAKLSKYLLNRTAKGSRYCQALIRNFLELVSSSEFHPQPIDLAETIYEVIAFMQGRMPDYIQLKQSISPSVPKVRADRKQLEQAFTNLIRNALQSMPDDGTLSISAQARTGGTAVEIEVTDTGSGIPQDSLDRIFDLDFTTRRWTYGTGLYIVKRIIDRHQGSIAVRSEVGKGTRFTIRLPVH